MCTQPDSLIPTELLKVQSPLDTQLFRRKERELKGIHVTVGVKCHGTPSTRYC